MRAWMRADRLDFLIHEPAEVYHAKAKDFLSSHALADFRESPLLFRKRQLGLIPDEDRPAYQVGRAAHTLILEGHEEYQRRYAFGGPINPKTGERFGTKTKAHEDWAQRQGKPVLPDDQAALAETLCASVRSHDFACELLAEGTPEGVLRRDYRGIPCQARLDWLNPAKGLVDLKTCDYLRFLETDARRFGYPEPVLAFAGALSLQAVLAGRKVRDPSDNRTALYLLALANSGAGKDQPRKVNQQILVDVGLHLLFADKFASGEGIEDRLFVNPSALFQTDELDLLISSINKGKDARYEGIMNTLLKMFTSANALYPMRVRAGVEPGVIDQPCLCVFGTAIPQNYYESLSMKMLTNGFFARQLVLESRKRAKGCEPVVKPIPDWIITTARWWAEFQPGDRRGNLQHWHPVPRVIELAPGALDRLRQFRERADDEYSLAEDKNDPVRMAIWARANEKARRLALVYACSKNHEAPLIDLDGASWAAELVDHQTRRMLFMANQHVSENEFDARCKKLVVILRKWQEKHGDDWMPFWAINRRLPWSQRDHEEVRTTLMNQRVIDFSETGTGGRPSRMYRLLAA